ncbi:MAG TPA: phosphotransferase, partial [Solirubrobacteraceae bacterium]|nr:phosphotransferase [Solirubrobacteraceae bacterium]
MASFIRRPEEIDGAWLSAVLDRPGLELIGTERIGTGQMSQSHRVRIRSVDGEPQSVVIKLASDDPTSRATGVGMGIYYREVAFYRNLAERIGDPLPGCHLAEYDRAEGWFTLVLEDVQDALQGDQIAGCGVDDARVALRTLARVHAPVLGDVAVGTADFLNQPDPMNQELMNALLAGFIERYGDQVAPEHQEVCRRVGAVRDALIAEQVPPLGLVHGDYRLDNLLF